MKRLIPTALLSVAVFAPCLAFAAGSAPAGRVRLQAVDEAEGAKYMATIDGMMCIECQKKVQAALEKIDGVAKVEVVWEKGSADVTLKDADGVLTLEQVRKALADHKEFTVKEVKKA